MELCVWFRREFHYGTLEEFVVYHKKYPESIIVLKVPHRDSALLPFIKDNIENSNLGRVIIEEFHKQ